MRNIRKYLRLTTDGDQLSTSTLLLHLLAFGSFLFSIVILLIAYTIYLAAPNFAWTFDLYMFVNIIWVSAAFFSQILLCTIFWLLSEPEKVVASPDTPEVQYGAINEEATVQARVWNSFLKSSGVAENDTASLLNYTVTPAQIIKASALTTEYHGKAFGLANSKTNTDYLNEEPRE